MVQLAAVLCVASFAGVLGAAWVVVLDCGVDDQCSGGGTAQMYVAFIGFGLAVVALLTSVLRRGRPAVWICATGLLWATWLVLIWQL